MLDGRGIATGCTRNCRPKAAKYDTRNQKRTNPNNEWLGKHLATGDYATECCQAQRIIDPLAPPACGPSLDCKPDGSNGSTNRYHHQLKLYERCEALEWDPLAEETQEQLHSWLENRVAQGENQNRPGL